MSQIDYLKFNEELLDQLERIGNKNLIGEAMKAELTRSQRLCLKTELTQLIHESMLLHQKIRDESPMLLSRHPDIGDWFQSQRRCLERLLSNLEQSDTLPAA